MLLFSGMHVHVYTSGIYVYIFVVRCMLDATRSHVSDNYGQITSRITTVGKGINAPVHKWITFQTYFDFALMVV